MKILHSKIERNVKVEEIKMCWISFQYLGRDNFEPRLWLWTLYLIPTIWKLEPIYLKITEANPAMSVTNSQIKGIWGLETSLSQYY